MRKQLSKFFAAASLCSLLLTPFPSFAQVPDYVPTIGLVGWWPFNGNANDESGNGNNGTVNGATLTADRFGEADKAYSFDGEDDWFEANINQNNSFAVSIWVNYNAFISTGIVWQHKNNCGRGGGFMLMNINGNLRFYTYKCGECSLSNCNDFVDIPNVTALQQGEWYHIVLNKSVDGNTKIFVNGNEVLNITDVNTNINYGSQPFSIGKWHDTPDLYYSAAVKDDIGIWNRALTQCEIQDLYDAQLGSSSNVSETSCGSFFWNNNTYTQSGQYQFQTTTAQGCDSTANLNLTINQPSASTQTQTALDSYTWPVNGQTYTQSGTYTAVIPNAAGCDSTITLNLTMNYTGIEDFEMNGFKKLLKITDLNGRETPFRKNTVLLFIYEDGTVERVFEAE
ncbi:MAG: LamG domain-containing protein [Bacteroidota bacterium]